MFFRHSSSISSSPFDESINLRLRILLYRSLLIPDYVRQNGVLYHNENLLADSNYKNRKFGKHRINNTNVARHLNIEGSQHSFENMISRYDDSSSDDRTIDVKFRHSRSTQLYTDRKLISPVTFRRRSQYKSFDRNPRRNRFCYSPIDIYQACEVMMVYRNDLLTSDETDQIVIKQKQNSNNDDQTVIVYKGCLKNYDTFSFKSQHPIECPFNVLFYINGNTDVHFSTCCEYKHRQGGFFLGQSFVIEHIVKSTPCQKCRRREEKDNKQTISLNSFDKQKVSQDRRSHKSRQKLISIGKTINDEKQKQEKNKSNYIQSENIHIQSINSTDNQNRNHQETSKEKTKKISLSSSSSPSSLSTEMKENLSSQQEFITPKHEIIKSKEHEDDTESEFNQKLREKTMVDNDNSGKFFQALLSILQSGLRRMDLHKSVTPRCEGNVENFLVILFGIKDQSNWNRSIVNFIKIFDSIKELNSFIDTLTYERIILIVSDSLAESIDNLSRFNSIYLLSSNVTRTTNHLNIHGNFPNLKSIFEKINEECEIENDFFSIQFSSTNEIRNQSFCYSQLLKETLLKNDNESNLKEDFLDFSRFHYNGNYIESTLINEFEQDFTIEKSIWWYTRNSFIRKMLNRALRTEEIDILYKTRWFIQVLNRQIKENNFSATVYRVHHYSSDQFKKFKEHNLNNFISFNTFLDCTLNQPSTFENIPGMETILFRIKTTIGIKTEQLRYFESKTDVLLPFDNIYRISSIEEMLDDNNHWWNINLTNMNKDNEQWNELIKEMHEEIDGPIVLIQLGKLLLLNNDYSHADYLARLLFYDGSLKDNSTLLASLAALHHLLGSFDNRQCNYQPARLQFEQSLKIFLTFIPEDNQILSATYNNIGSMFYQEDQHEQAIIFHQKALQCQLKSSSPDMEAIATYSGNVGAVYLDQGKYDQALLYYKRSLQILLQSVSNGESQSIALVYDRIASVYWRMDKPTEALPFYQKTLQLELKYLQGDDHKISVSYFNLSTAYAKLNRLDDAIDCAEKSVQQLLKCVSLDHSEVKENTDQLEGLRRRKWLQQLYE
ncbi:unnamed protein product [Rotaria socialis]|uniref:DUF4590 domain-containing protein n=1 Tax=Rotaria socialis TaxID=392032 RepID=A0A821NQL1_9BILA|nr:unnamed protein product [Rotaria socialis]CAF4789224.1 unnamed protein product [Rotaria socialis]